jgi:hypothetical protein
MPRLSDRDPQDGPPTVGGRVFTQHMRSYPSYMESSSMRSPRTRYALVTGPPIVSCPRQFIRHIRSYPSYMEASSIQNPRTRYTLVTGTHITDLSYRTYNSDDEPCTLTFSFSSFAQRMPRLPYIRHSCWARDRLTKDRKGVPGICIPGGTSSSVLATERKTSTAISYSI